MLTLLSRIAAMLVVLSLMSSLSAQASQLTSRIVGGSTVVDDRYPFMVAVSFDLDGDGFFVHGCGGSLVSDTWVLTAAHCVVDPLSGQLVNNNSVAVLVGSRDIFDQSQGMLISASRIVVHPAYQAQTFTNDIALIELSQAVELPVIALPASGGDVPAVGEDATVTGWGNTVEGGLKSRLLREVELPITSHAQCLPFYASSLSSTANVCAGGAAATGRDSCQGDSGGPLFVERDSEFVQAGIVSFGEGCARPDIPGVYTRVQSYTDWVASIVPDIVVNTSGVGVTEQGQPLNDTPLLLQLTDASPVQSGSLLVGEVAIYEITGANRVELTVATGDADLIVSEGESFEVEDVICRSENRTTLDACDLADSSERRFAIVFAYAPSDFDIRVANFSVGEATDNDALPSVPTVPTVPSVPDGAEQDGEDGMPLNDGVLSESSSSSNFLGFFGMQWLLVLGGFVLLRRRFAVAMR